jgi:SAM-dependent methyltransferase
VLDVCCGTGAFAIPAAERVGPAGQVLGVDVAEALLELARRKAQRLGLTNPVFQAGSLDALDGISQTFDVVACVFGVFFADDMGAATARLWHRVGPGGALAITTWGPGLFAPADRVFWEAVEEVRPELARSFQPWDRITTPAALGALLDDAGLDGALTIAEEPGTHTIASPADWWTLVLGSGYRGTVEALTPLERSHVRQRCDDVLGKGAAAEITAHVIYAIARKG